MAGQRSAARTIRTGGGTIHTLHLTRIGQDVPELTAIQVVREALRTLQEAQDGPVDRMATARDANTAIERTRARGAYLLGRNGSLELLADVAAALEQNGCEAMIDLTIDHGGEPMSPEQVFDATRPDAGTEDEGDGDSDEAKVYSSESYETAMTLLVQSDGNPVNAAQYAHILGRTTGDESLYIEVINALIRVFPWVREPMLAHGLITYDDTDGDAA